MAISTALSTTSLPPIINPASPSRMKIIILMVDNSLTSNLFSLSTLEIAKTYTINITKKKRSIIPSPEEINSAACPIIYHCT